MPRLIERSWWSDSLRPGGLNAPLAQLCHVLLAYVPTGDCSVRVRLTWLRRRLHGAVVRWSSLMSAAARVGAFCSRWAICSNTVITISITNSCRICAAHRRHAEGWARASASSWAKTSANTEQFAILSCWTLAHWVFPPVHVSLFRLFLVLVSFQGIPCLSFNQSFCLHFEPLVRLIHELPMHFRGCYGANYNLALWWHVELVCGVQAQRMRPRLKPPRFAAQTWPSSRLREKLFLRNLLVATFNDINKL